ncbi:hypothetical protein DMA11_09500 [Marinilabiliaceae bacterium JC017]|nr:hypothetical protein DMA11_09500 [Marinilabiliaceae bacterium JC017]
MIYLIIGIVIALAIAFWASAKGKDQSKSDQQPTIDIPSDCCGAHEVCESESLLNFKAEIIYYEDEELDAFKNVEDAAYTDDQIEEFRDILYSLRAREVAGWLKSLQLREITPPSVIREEALLIVAELREK